ncbi:MAG: hypothetical protein GX383_12795 [Clostridium sp.]|nr:hypothetical protein [Clostridium sp.]
MYNFKGVCFFIKWFFPESVEKLTGLKSDEILKLKEEKWLIDICGVNFLEKSPIYMYISINGKHRRQ